MNSFYQRRIFEGAVAMLVTCLMATTLLAQDQQTDLPSGEEVLQKHIAASGGQAAYDKIENRFFQSTIEITNAGITLNASTYAAKPNKTSSTIEAPAIGKVLRGSTGEAVWSLSDLQGPVVEQGAALENQLRDSMLDRLVYWKKIYQSAECVGVEKVNGEECYKVVLTPRPYTSPELKDTEPSVLTVYFDKNTLLVKKIESNVVTDAGAIDVTAYLSDYKTVDGIMIAHRTEMELIGQKRVIEIQTIEHNVDLAEDQFDPPGEIKKLIEKAKGQ